MLKQTFIAAICFGSILYAGGKSTEVAKSPIVPIVQEDVNPWYLGVGIIPFGKFNTDCYEDVTYGAMLRGGYEFNQYFGLEARAMKTFAGEGPNGGETFQHFGLYAKPMYPVSERFNIYALAGYGYTETINDGGNGNLPEIDDWDFSWGVGLEYDLSDKKGDFIQDAAYDRGFDGYADQERGWGIFVDYQSLWMDHKFHHRTKGNKKVDLSVVSVGITYDF